MTFYEQFLLHGWQPKEIAGEWGYEQYWICPTCGALIQDPVLHTWFHFSKSANLKRGGE